MKNPELVLDGKFLRVYNNDGWVYASRKHKTVSAGNSRPDAVVILGKHIVTKKVPVIRQFRKSINDYIWELPAGLVEEGESVTSAAARELLEETGLKIDHVDSVVDSFPSIGMSDEIQTIVQCTVYGDVKLGRHGVDDEDITLEMWGKRELGRALATCENVDGRLAMLSLLWRD